MPERVYLNRRAGEERIHVEIDKDDITAILNDLSGNSAPAQALRDVLQQAQRDLNPRAAA